MPVQSLDQDRMARGPLIDPLAGRQLNWLPIFMVPVAIENPPSFWCLGRKLANPLPKDIGTPGIAQLDTRQALPPIEEVNVSVVESRKHPPPGEVDDLRFGPNPPPRLGGCSDCDQLPPQRGHCFHFGLVLIPSPNLPVQQHQVSLDRTAAPNADHSQQEDGPETEPTSGPPSSPDPAPCSLLRPIPAHRFASSLSFSS